MEAVTREELEAIRNHMSNLPSVGAMYAPVLVEWSTVLLRQRDELQAKLDAELPAAWREDLASLNECLERVSRDLYEARSEIDHHKRQVLVSEAKHKEAARERDEARADAERIRQKAIVAQSERDHARVESKLLQYRLDAAGDIISANGCDCDCDHDAESHDADCDRCLACRISDALWPRVSE